MTVQQFDYHLPSLTVLETLTFQSQIRLPLQTSTVERERRVLEVIRTLGLQQCAKIRVGSEEVKGISGGEKRRLSIGIQLLSDPMICLFDEPTTGLDTFTARHIVLTLKTLAITNKESSSSNSSSNSTSKKTVILSIHQPRYDIFACIDDVILLSRGDLIWSGSVSTMLQHFQSIGYPCPAFSNPADFILDLSSIDFRTAEREQSTRDTLASLVLSFQSRTDFPKLEMVETAAIPRLTDLTNDRNDSEDLTTGMKSSSLVSKPATTPSVTTSVQNEKEIQSWKSMIKPDYFTFPILLSRAWMNISRQPDLLLNRFTQSVFFGLILCCFFAPIGNDQNSIQNRVGILQELTALCFIGMLSCIAIYPNERNVFYREYVDGYYTARSFVMTYFAIAIPILIVSAFGVSLLMVYAIGINPGNSTAWLAFTYVLFCFMFTGESLGIMFCSVFQHVGFSLNIISAVITIFTNTAGFFSLSMPLFIVIFSYISPISWGSYILSNIAFEDETFSCTDDEQTNGSCLATGDAVLDLYDFNQAQMPLHYIIIGAVTAGYWLLAVIAVRVSAYRLSH